MQKNSPITIVALAALLIPLGVGSLQAQTSQFTNTGGTGLWSNSLNWSAGIPNAGIAFLNVPAAGTPILNYAAPDVTYILIGQGSGTGSLSVQSGASLLVSREIRVGQGQVGVYTQSGGAITTSPSTDGHFSVGWSSPSAGSSAAISGGTLNVGGNLNVALADAASMSITGSGEVTVTGTTTVGINGSVGTLLIDGGTLNAATILLGQPAGVGSGSLIIDGGAAVAFSAMDIRANTGLLEIAGSGNTINGTSISVNTEIIFTLDAMGASTVNLTGNLFIQPGADLTIDGTAFTGPGTFTLFDTGGLAGGFATINYVGFAPDTAEVTFDANNVYLTIVPEPTSVALMALGLGALGIASRSRSRRMVA